VEIMPGVSAVAAGQYHTMILATDGTLLACGKNQFGQLGDGSHETRLKPVAVMRDVARVSASHAHSLVLKKDGSLWAAGRNHRGQLGDGTKENRASFVKVMDGVRDAAAGGEHSLMLALDGTMLIAGANFCGVDGGETLPKPVAVSAGVAAIATGASVVLFKKEDGSLWGCGYNRRGALGDGTFVADRYSPQRMAKDFETFASGERHTAGILRRELWATGNNFAGQLGDGTREDRSSFVKILDEVEAVAPGYYHTLILKADGTVWATGDNRRGQLGDGTTEQADKPVKVRLP